MAESIPVDLTRTRAFGNRSTDLRVDWFRVLVQIKDQGYSLYSVSHFTGISKSSLINYKQGAQPSYHQGVRLVSCWAEVTGKPVEAVPMISPFSHTA